MGRLQKLLQDLTLLHGQVLGTLELDRQELDLSAWLLPLLRPWQTVAEEKQMEWVIEISDDLPPVKFDPLRLGQAVGNLVGNAIKYSPPGAKISIRAGLEGRRILARDRGHRTGDFHRRAAKNLRPILSRESRPQVSSRHGPGVDHYAGRGQSAWGVL